MIEKMLFASVRISSLAKLSLLVLPVLLTACSGGSGGGASERPTSVTEEPETPVFVYDGPPPATQEIQNFKISFYDNLVADDRCGSCHTPGGGAPTTFVNRDDVNAAWQAANSVSNLIEPVNSDVVQRVGNGHNCWLGATATATCSVTVQSYIEQWAAGNSPAGKTSVNLQPRTYYEPVATKKFPANYTAVTQLPPGGFELSATGELLDLLAQYCVACHSDTSAQSQTPFFASSDNDIAYEALRGRVNLSVPVDSRLVIRVAQERHNCGGACDAIASEFEAAITRFADLIPAEVIDVNTTQISAAQGLLRDGVIASTGGRFEDNLIAKWEFREGQGNTIADTSGVAPAAVLTATGNYEWMNAWGMRFDGGRAQASVFSSNKLKDQITATGEYTIEAWVAPFNVSQTDAWIFAYAGSNTSRNVLLTQTLYNYDIYTRNSTNTASSGGEPAVSTDDDAEFAQASLQHVVLTYDPLEGRKIYVNGVDTQATDTAGGGLLNNWNDSFAVTIGNSPASNRTWQGAVRMVAVHNRRMTPEQIQANFDVGVGQQYYMLFSISSHIDAPDNCHTGTGSERIDYCYIIFEVSEYDDASYLFNRPAFININPSPVALNFDIQGMRLGINGQLAIVGQGFSNLNLTVDSTQFTDIGFSQPGQILTERGTIIAKELGSIGTETDIFFLAFEGINSRSSTFDDGPDKAVDYSFTAQGDENVSDIVFKTFDGISQSFSAITGISSANTTPSAVTGTSVAQTFAALRQQLPSVDDFQAYMSSHQMAVTQLAAAYCDALVQDVGLRDDLFPGFDFSANVSTHPQMSDETVIGEEYWGVNIVDPLIDKSMNTGLLSADIRSGIRARVVQLITDPEDNAPYVFDGNNYIPSPDPAVHTKKDGLRYCENNAPCPDARTSDVVKGACVAILASGGVLIH